MTGPSERSGPRLNIWLTVAVLPVFAVLLGLGYWQVQRLEWKAAIIAEREANLAKPPIAVGIPNAEPYRRASASGRFLHDRELRIAHQVRHGQPGFNIITPLEFAPGRHVLVIRGWVPEQRADPAKRPEGQIAGRVSVSGLMRAGGKANRWIPDNEPEKGAWYYLDSEAMARAVGLEDVEPLFLVADKTPNPGGYPLGKAVEVKIRNQHLEYALTWFALAGVLLVIYVVYQLKRGRERRDEA